MMSNEELRQAVALENFRIFLPHFLATTEDPGRLEIKLSHLPDECFNMAEAFVARSKHVTNGA